MQFKDIAGHTELKERLLKSVRESRVSHALLFLGQEGAGALPLAFAFAQYISCENRGETDSCGTCKSCYKYERFAHPDLHFILPIVPKKNYAITPDTTKDLVASSDFIFLWRKAFDENPYQNLNDWFNFLEAENKQANIPVDECNELLRKFSLKTYESPYRICIIWQPERLHKDGANKLLKMLEEPPPNSYFILVPEQADLILPTVSSRTQLIKINRPEDEILLRLLVDKEGISHEKAEQVVRLSDGNQREIRRLLQENDSDINQVTDLRNWWVLAFRSVDGKGVKELLEWVDAMQDAGREKQKAYLHYALHIFRECLLIKNSCENLVRMNDLEKNTFSKFPAMINLNNCFSFEDELNQAYYHIERNANGKVIFLDLSIRLGNLLRLKADLPA